MTVHTSSFKHLQVNPLSGFIGSQVHTRKDELFCAEGGTLELRQAIMETLRVLLDEAQGISIATAVTGVVATAMILTRFE